MSATPPPTKDGPAKGTRSKGGAAASASHSSNAAAAAGDQLGEGADDEGKDATPALSDDEAEPDALDASAAGVSDGDKVAAMLREMQTMRAELKKLKQAQPQQQQQSLSLDASPSSASAAPSFGPSSGDIAALVRALQDGQIQQAEQARKQQAASSAQLLLLQSLGELPSFNGKGGDTTLIAQEWLQRSEDFFTAREQATGVDAVLGDKARVLAATNALQDDARRWFTALPKRPATWAEFQSAVKARFCSVPSERIRVDRLTAFIDQAARVRDKLNVSGMQAFTARFLQLAGEVPDDLVTGRGKLALLARALPQRYSEVVLQEEAKKPTPPLHQVIDTVLSRASQKEQAASYGGSSSAPASAAPMQLDAISLAITTFGWTREEAQRNLSDGEGWAPHDTNGGPQSSQGSSSSGPASSASPPPTTLSHEQVTQLLAAFGAHGAKVGAGPAARERSSRRNAPSGMAKEIPQELFEARKKAGLCCKCGVAKYEPGAHGHNSRTCKGAVDKTTSTAEGIKKANF